MEADLEFAKSNAKTIEDLYKSQNKCDATPFNAYWLKYFKPEWDRR